MKSTRIGMGKGRGTGYKNMLKTDPVIHSNSARGRKTYSNPTARRMEQTSAMLSQPFKDKKRFTTPTQIVDLDLEIKSKTGRSFENPNITTSGRVLSISGSLFERTGGRPRVSSFGQVHDSIETKDPKLRRVIQIWRRWHLNDLKAGTKAQEEALKNWKERPEGFSHEQDVEYLKSKNLHVDKGYEYGTAWLFEPLPANIENEIKRLFG